MLHLAAWAMGGINAPMSALRLGPTTADARSALRLGPTDVARSALRSGPTEVARSALRLGPTDVAYEAWQASERCDETFGMMGSMVGMVASDNQANPFRWASLGTPLPVNPAAMSPALAARCLPSPGGWEDRTKVKVDLGQTRAQVPVSENEVPACSNMRLEEGPGQTRAQVSVSKKDVPACSYMRLDEGPGDEEHHYVQEAKQPAAGTANKAMTNLLAWLAEEK